MSKYDAELLSGSIGEAARELTEAVLTEFDTWAKSEPTQAAGMAGGKYETGKAAAEIALSDVRGLLADYLPSALSVVLTSWGLLPADSE